MKCAVLFALGVLLFAASSEAALRRTEALGAVDVQTANASTSDRERALRAGVEAAAVQVAENLLRHAGGQEISDETLLNALRERLHALLGKDAFDYAARYRVLEDRGLRNVEENAASDGSKPRIVTKEYVVVVEAFVDEERVRDTLRSAGLLVARAATTDGAADVLLVIAQPLTSYRAYTEIDRALSSLAGVESAVPVRFASQQAVFAVRGSLPVRALFEALKQNLSAKDVLIEGKLENNALFLAVQDVARPAPSATEGAGNFEVPQDRKSEMPQIAPVSGMAGGNR